MSYTMFLVIRFLWYIIGIASETDEDLNWRVACWEDNSGCWIQDMNVEEPTFGTWYIRFDNAD